MTEYNFQNTFAAMQGRAKTPGSSQIPMLPVGTHLLAVKKYGIKPTQANFNVEANFVVLQTNNPQLRVGETREKVWFPNSDKFGTEQGRMLEFPVAIGRGIGMSVSGIHDPQVTQVGDWMSQGMLNGAQIRVTVTQPTERDGVTPKRSKAGNLIYEFVWTAVEGQTKETIEASRAKMVELEVALPPVIPATTVAAPAAAPAASPANANPFAGFQQPAAPAQPAPAVFGFPAQTQTAPAPQAPTNPFAGLPSAPAQPAPVAAPVANPLGALFANLPK